MFQHQNIADIKKFLKLQLKIKNAMKPLTLQLKLLGGLSVQKKRKKKLLK